MQKEAGQEEVLSQEVQDVMRHFIAALRAVKLYPANNPIYLKSVKKSHEMLENFLVANPEYGAGVQKTFFTYQHTPVGKEAQLNTAIALDLFTKGIREIVFSAGLSETELLEICRALALSSEEMAMKGGISSIIWEQEMEHVRVTESDLEDVVTSQSNADKTDGRAADSLDRSETKKKVFPGRTLVLGDLVADPSGFASSMLELAKRTRAENESVEDRLFALYQEAARRIAAEHPDESNDMFESLAKSALSLDPNFRDALVAGKLYRDLDTEMAGEQPTGAEEQLPTSLHELQAGRFSHAWTSQNVATLLKKTATKKSVPPTPALSPAELNVTPIPGDLPEIAAELAKYTPEEMTELKVMGESGSETDIFDAVVRTLRNLLLYVKNPLQTTKVGRDAVRFSSLVSQLETLLNYFLNKADYHRARTIIEVLRLPVDPEFEPRMLESLKKVAPKNVLLNAIEVMRKNAKASSQYQEAYDYLSVVEREATEVLLELMSEEKDRNARIFYLDLAKDVGKNQIALLGESLSDGRWYVIRNIISILGETKTDQAILFLRKTADHKDVRIRQEVIRGLISIGGKKAASVLARFLGDRDADIRMMAIRSFADIQGISAEDAKPVVSFLEGRPLKKKEREITLEAIKTLGKTGGRDAAELLNTYTRIRWWKPRKLQVECRTAALQAIQDITRRQDDAGRAKR